MPCKRKPEHKSTFTKKPKLEKTDVSMFITKDIWSCIFSHLSILDVVRCRQVCKTSNDAFTISPVSKTVAIIKKDIFTIPHLSVYVGKTGDEELIDFLLNQYMEKLPELAWGLAAGGHLELLKKYFGNSMEERCSECILYGATRGKHQHVINYILQEVKEKSVEFYTQGIVGSVKAGDLDMAGCFIEELKQTDDCEEEEFNYSILFGIRVAAEAGNINAINYLVGFLEQTDSIGKSVLDGVSKGGKVKLLDYALDMTPEPDVTSALYHAAWGRRMDMVQLLLQKFPDTDVDKCITGACAGGDMDIFNLLLSKCKTPDWNSILAVAAEWSSLQIIEVAKKSGKVTDYVPTLNAIFKRGNIASEELLITAIESSRKKLTNDEKLFLMDKAVDHGNERLFLYSMHLRVNIDLKSWQKYLKDEGKLKMLDILMDHVDPNALDK